MNGLRIVIRFFMSPISVFLQAVHVSVHDFTMKRNFSDPKIFTGGIDVSGWSKLSPGEQKNALAKDWYVYFPFREPKTGKLVRQPNIKAGVNRYKNKRERLALLRQLQAGLLMLLQKGFDPYADNQNLIEKHFPRFYAAGTGKDCVTQSTTPTCKSVPASGEMEFARPGCSLNDAFALALEIKKSTLTSTSYSSFQSNAKKFKKWLLLQGFTGLQDINCITKAMVIQFLNDVLQTTSARTRNNTRLNIGSLVQIWVDNEMISENFVRRVNVLKSSPERHKTYTPTLQRDIFEYMETHDSVLALFVKFISYNYLRPVEVCRLRIGDIDLQDRKLYVRAKNNPVKIKIIPDILIHAMPDLKSCKVENLVFTPDRIGGDWPVSENDRRNYFSKRFKKVKDYFRLGADYGLYSFRHTFITRLYNEFTKSMTPFEAKSKLMLITGHLTMDALEKYLRNIDAVLPEDYSSFL
jgi:integrase